MVQLPLKYLVIALLLCAACEAVAEEPQVVALCDVLKDPAKYNHKLIQTSGTVSRGFEVFTLSDSNCKTHNDMWLEFGGRKGSEVTYCCGNNHVEQVRESALVVEGIETSLVQDDKLDSFETQTRALHQGYRQTNAMLVGRYFSGQPQSISGETVWGGYGHMGMATLLVIQQVLAAGPQ